MAHECVLGTLSRLAATSLGVFRGGDAVALGVTRKQIGALVRAGAVDRVLPDTYRTTTVAASHEQSLRAALLWAGDDAAAAARSAARLYGLEGVRAERPEIVVPRSSRIRSADVVVHYAHDRRPLLIRQHGGVRVTGIEATLVALAAELAPEAFEIACEDARRRRLTSVPALRAYLSQHGKAGRAGVTNLRGLLDDLDPVHAARSTLEVKTRRLLVANGISQFVREFPIDWNGRTYASAFPAGWDIASCSRRGTR
jgi:hypothetical protein